MTSDEKIFENAKKLHLNGQIKNAQEIYLKLFNKNENNFLLNYLLGTSFLQTKEYINALNYLNKSIELKPNFAEAYNNKGITLAEIGEYSEALENYDKAIKHNKNFTDAYLNRGISLSKLGRYNDAIKNFEAIIKIYPTNKLAYNNLGNVFKNNKDHQRAILNYNKALEIDPNYLDALVNKANSASTIKLHEQELECLKKIFELNPNYEDIIFKLTFKKMQLCDWKNFDKYRKLIYEKIIKHRVIFDPLFLNYLFDDEKLNKINAENKIKNEFKLIKKNTKTKSENNKKIKIAYFSADYHNHPVLHAMKDIFKFHDSKNFEIYGFSHGPIKKNNIWREEIKPYFKEFYSIEDISDEEVVNISNKLNLDIAVNLTGFAKYNRTNLFCNRVAPVQINYLGYPGTMASEAIDYIIADNIIIPEENKKNYTEKVVCLNTCFMPISNPLGENNSQSIISKDNQNLPEKKIIFCAISNPVKINPEILDLWAEILNEVEDSVIWINAKSEIYKKNFKSEMKKRKISSDRIIFSRRVENINNHINRLKFADIFLDTYPYNSHATMYDNIKAELPTIVFKGNSYASRVGASIYSSIDMNELVVENKLDYKNLAIELAKNKNKLLQIKNKLVENTKKFNLFDNKKITKELERVYKELV